MSKLTGNVDTYPCWDNKIHKELKLKNYATNVDSRLINLKMNKDANLDFNNRYFPPKSQGIPTIKSLVDERELEIKASKHGIINNNIYTYTEQYIQSKNIPPNLSKKQFDLVVKDIENGFNTSYTKNAYSKNEIETAVKQTLKDLERGVINQSIADKNKSNIQSYNQEIEEANKRAIDEYKEGLLMGYEDSMTALNIKRMKEAEKQASRRIILDDIANAEEEEQKAAYVAPIGIPASRIEEEEQSSSASSSKHSSPAHSTHSSFASTYAQSSMTGSPKKRSPMSTTKASNEPSAKALKDELTKEIEESGEQTKNGITLIIHNKKLQKVIKSSEGKQTYVAPLKTDLLTFSEFTSAGIKIKKSKNALINRFNILRGELLSGNDNPKIIKEIKTLSKKLYEMKLLDKHL